MTPTTPPRYTPPQRMARLLPRYQPGLEEQTRQRLDRVIADAAPAPNNAPTVRAGGDRRRLRGIPVVGPGVGGTSPGSDPLGELLRRPPGSRP